MKTHAGEGDANEDHPLIIYWCYEKTVERWKDEMVSLAMK